MKKPVQYFASHLISYLKRYFTLERCVQCNDAVSTAVFHLVLPGCVLSSSVFTQHSETSAEYILSNTSSCVCWVSSSRFFV